MTDSVPQLLTLLEVADKLRVSSHSVRSWVRQGRLCPTRICRRLLFTSDEVTRFLKEAGNRPNHDTGGCGFEQKPDAL
jgi:excisionase family DNA binding protein